jgi:hypothetical protein
MKPNIGYEMRVYLCKNGQYYHTKKDCSMLLPNDFKGLGYKEVPISQVPKSYTACPTCSKDWK